MSGKDGITIAEAKRLVAQDEAEQRWFEEDQAYNASLQQFRDVPAREVIQMWETGKDQRGRKLSKDQFAALVERWVQVFGDLPAGDDDSAAGNSAEGNTVSVATNENAEPLPDTMLKLGEVARVTGLSASTIKRMVNDGRFPKALKLSPRRIGWQAATVTDWLEARGMEARPLG